MSTFTQQTVDLLKSTEHSLGSPDSLSTSDTQRLQKEFNKSPIHSGDLTRENVQSTFDSIVLHGPADVDNEGNVVKPPLGVDVPTMDYFDDEDQDDGITPFGAPSVGGEGGTPKGPNLVAAAALASGASLDDGLASPPAAGAYSAGSSAGGSASAGGIAGAFPNTPSLGETNTIYGAGAEGAGGGGSLGGSDNPAKSSKVISGQGTNNLAMGSSTPTSVDG